MQNPTAGTDDASEFHLGLHRVTNLLNDLNSLRRDLDAKAEIIEEGSREVKRRAEAAERNKREETKKTEEMVEMLSLSGDETTTRLNTELGIRQANLNIKDSELLLLRNKAVTVMMRKMETERRMGAAKKEAEERERLMVWRRRRFEKAQSELKTLVTIKNELFCDLEVLHESIERTSAFNLQLERSVLDGDKCLQRQSGVLAQLRLELPELRARLKEANRVLAQGTKGEERKRLERELGMVEEELQDRMAEAEETEQALQKIEKSNEMLAGIFQELDSAQKSRRSKRREVGCQVGEQCEEEDNAKEQSNMIDPSNIKKECDVIEIN